MQDNNKNLNKHYKGKRRKKKKRKKKIFKMIIFFIITIIILFGIFILYNLSRLNDKAQKLDSKIPNNKDFVNILAMGVDIGDPKNFNNPKRTDTMILVNYNFRKDRLTLISIPRDTRIQTEQGSFIKINDAHARGGVKLAVKTVENLLDIKIDYYGKIDYSGFRKLIDSIGGVKVDIDRDMIYDDYGQNLHINLKKGKNVQLDGEKAEQFFRWRKNNDGTGLINGDIDRIENQHKFINKVFEKVKSPVIIPRIPSIVSTLPEYVETNLSTTDMLSYVMKLSKVKKENVYIKTLPGEGKYIGEVSYYLYDSNASKDILKLIKDVDYNNINKENFKVNILNETTKSGLAQNLGNYIKKKGYKNISTGNLTGKDKTKIIFYGIDEQTANIIKNDFNINNFEISKEKKDEFDVVVLLGHDHEYINE